MIIKFEVKPPSSKVAIPENVDKETLQVMFDDFCEIPMQYVGIEAKGHEFKCGAEFGECHRDAICPKFRHIPLDNGCFQRILYGSESVSKAHLACPCKMKSVKEVFLTHTCEKEGRSSIEFPVFF